MAPSRFFRTSPCSVYLVVFCCLSTVNSYSEDWEEPNDIFGSSKSPCGPDLDNAKAELTDCRAQFDALRATNKCSGPRIVKQPSVADHYLKRFINVLLSSADFKHRKLGEGREMTVVQNLFFNSETLSVLQAFASDDTNGHSWAELDAAFISVFDGVPESRGYFDSFDQKSDPGTNMFERNHLPLVVGVMCSFAFCVIWVFLVGRSLKSSLFVASVLVFSFCFGWTWWAEFEHHRMQFLVQLSRTESDLPEACKNPSEGWFGWFLQNQREAECFNYLKTRNIHPMVAVDMSRVMTKTLTLVFSWLPALATSTSKAIDAFYGDSWVGSLTGFTAKVFTGPSLWITGLLMIVGYVVTRSTFVFKAPGCLLGFGRAPTGVQVERSQPQAEQPQQYFVVGGGSDQVEKKKQKEKALQLKFRTQPKIRRAESARASESDWWLMSHRLKVRPSRKQEEKRFRELRRAFLSVEESRPMEMW